MVFHQSLLKIEGMKLKQKCICGGLLGLLLAIGSFSSDVVADGVFGQGAAVRQLEKQLAITRPGTNDDGPPASRTA